MTTESDMKKPTLEDLAELCAESARLVGEWSMVVRDTSMDAMQLREKVKALEGRVRVLEEQVAGDGR